MTPSMVEGGAGLDTLRLPESKLRATFERAGFVCGGTRSNLDNAFPWRIYVPFWSATRWGLTQRCAIVASDLISAWSSSSDISNRQEWRPCRLRRRCNRNDPGVVST